MAEQMTVDEILDFAIAREQEAADFYKRLAEQAKVPAMRDVFAQFAAEEGGHKMKLQNVKAGKSFLSSSTTVPDLKLGDYLVEEEPTPNMDYPAALILAMQKEKAAFRLYTDLAARTDNGDIRGLLLGLAQEEAKHKLRFEIEYDDHVLTEN